MATFNININPYEEPTLNITTINTTPCEITIGVDFFIEVENYKLYIWGQEENTSPQLINSKVAYTIYTDPGATYEFYITAEDKVTGNTISSQTLVHVAGEVPINTDSFVFINTLTVDIDDARAIKAAMQGWYAEYKIVNNLTGNIYFIPINDGRYLKYASAVWSQDLYSIPTPDSIGNPWASEIAELPPKFNTIDWVPPINIILFAYTDATNNDYHSKSYDDNFTNFELTLNDPNISQPTYTFQRDYLEYLNQYHNNFNYLVNILFPVPKLPYSGVNSPTAAMILHGVAAMEGKLLTDSDITNINSKVDISLLKTNNPYTNFNIPNTYPAKTLKPLKEMGWVGNFKEEEPVANIFTSTGFKSKINNLLLTNRPDC